ncbi:hypothetical protein Tco_1022369 [Tanacetum coccineum]
MEDLHRPKSDEPQGTRYFHDMIVISSTVGKKRVKDKKTTKRTKTSSPSIGQTLKINEMLRKKKAKIEAKRIAEEEEAAKDKEEEEEETEAASYAFGKASDCAYDKAQAMPLEKPNAMPSPKPKAMPSPKRKAINSQKAGYSFGKAEG